MNEFLYCHDPLDESVGEYLIHLGNPYVLVKIISLDEEDEITTDEFIHKVFTYEGEGFEEKYQLILTPLANDSKKPSQLEAIPVLNAGWKYWTEILESEDDEDDE